MPIAIVTGGNSGIGKAAAVILAQRGFDVGITWFSAQDSAEETLEECRGHGVRAEAVRLDLDTTDPRALPDRAAPLEELIGTLGGVDVFVNNAGAGLDGAFLELELESFLRTQHLNLTGAFVCCQLAARAMVRQGRGGRIIVVTSVHEHVPLEEATAYVSAKHGAGGLVKNMALELGSHGITVNAVAPGEIATKMNDMEDEDPRGEERKGIPAGRPGDAREIGEAIAYLASPGAAYTTGHSLVVDGGLTMMGAVANQLAQ